MDDLVKKIQGMSLTRTDAEIAEYILGLTEQWEKARKPLKILGKTGVMR